MGLISRVSSRTYREKLAFLSEHFKMFQGFMKLNDIYPYKNGEIVSDLSRIYNKNVSPSELKGPTSQKVKEIYTAILAHPALNNDMVNLGIQSDDRLSNIMVHDLIKEVLHFAGYDSYESVGFRDISAPTSIKTRRILTVLLNFVTTCQQHLDISNQKDAEIQQKTVNQEILYEKCSKLENEYNTKKEELDELKEEWKNMPDKMEKLREEKENIGQRMKTCDERIVSAMQEHDKIVANNKPIFEGLERKKTELEDILEEICADSTYQEMIATTAKNIEELMAKQVAIAAELKSEKLTETKQDEEMMSLKECADKLTELQIFQAKESKHRGILAEMDNVIENRRVDLETCAAKNKKDLDAIEELKSNQLESSEENSRIMRKSDAIVRVKQKIDAELAKNTESINAEEQRKHRLQAVAAATKSELDSLASHEKETIFKAKLRTIMVERLQKNVHEGLSSLLRKNTALTFMDLNDLDKYVRKAVMRLDSLLE